MTTSEAIFKLIKYRRRLEEDSTIDAEPFDMAIEALQSQATLDDVSNAYENGYKQGKFEAQQWIPVSERLPEEGKDVLVSVHFHGLKNPPIKESYYVEVAHQTDGEWCSYSDDYKVAKYRHEVIAWMPLPEPYTEEEQ